MHALPTLGGADSYGYGINDSGQITGYSKTSGIFDARAFLWTPTTPNGTSGIMINLGTLEGGEDSYGAAINAVGQVAGVSGVPMPDDFVPPDPGDLFMPTIVTFEHAFLWSPAEPNGANGTLLDLGTLGGYSSSAYGLNVHGDVVGFSTMAVDPYVHAFIYTGGNGMVDLNSLIDPLSGWRLEFAYAINDAGQITGSGAFDDGIHAFLLTPVPEPSGLALAIFATLMGIAASRVHRRCR
jgi:probable HAF family extracellular repeat protein